VRLTRLVTAMAACGLVLLIALGPSSAFAATAAGPRGLPRREMNDEVFVNDQGWLIFRGDVDPGCAHKRVQIYKRLCKGCACKLVRQPMTDGAGRWRTRIYAPRTGYWYWKGVVPKSGDYSRSFTQVYRTYVT
jgi:hypothetical protein